MPTTSIPIQQLIPDRNQVRREMSESAARRLVANIRERGLLQPVRVRPADAAGNFVIVCGQNRVAALIELGATHVECVVADGPLDEATILGDQISENVIREDLSPVEEATAYRHYIAVKGITAAQAAEELGLPTSRISRYLALLDLPDEVRTHVHSGWIHRDTAYHLSRLEDGPERDRLMAQAVAGDLSRDEAARAAKPPRHQLQYPAPGRTTFKLDGGRTLTVSADAITLDTLIATLEQILKEARKARTQGWHVGTLAKVFRDRAAKGGAA